jgi:hypothetical protein
MCPEAKKTVSFCATVEGRSHAAGAFNSFSLLDLRDSFLVSLTACAMVAVKVSIVTKEILRARQQRLVRL